MKARIEMKKVFPFIAFFLFCAALCNAQTVMKKWAIVQDLDDRIVYLDTTTIKEFDNKITIWSLVIYRQPKEISPLQQKVAQIKSQFMINELVKKYSVIGTLYYDIKGKMIGETAIPNYSYNSDNFSIDILEGSTIDVLRNKAKDYLATGKFIDDRSEFLKNYDKNVVAKNSDIPAKKDSAGEAAELDTAVETKLKELTQIGLPVADSTVAKKKPVKKIEVKKDTITTGVEGMDKIVNSKIDSSKIKAEMEKLVPKDTTALNRLKKKIEIEKEAPAPVKIESDETPKKANTAVEKTPVEKSAAKKSSTPKIVSSSEYDFAKEKNVSGVIFSDGSLFCFQVSSWKMKSQADKEVSRLQSAGHNAFIQEAQLPGKGKWYRVRIGYFSSLEETSAYKKKVK